MGYALCNLKSLSSHLYFSRMFLLVGARQTLPSLGLWKEGKSLSVTGLLTAGAASGLMPQVSIYGGPTVISVPLYFPLSFPPLHLTYFKTFNFGKYLH